MKREDRQIKIEQNERIKNFERELRLSQINERIEKLEDIKNERNLLEEKRKKMEKELNVEKNEMENRIQKIMKNDDGLSRDEILNYVINDIQPNITNKAKTPISRMNKEKEKKIKIIILMNLVIMIIIMKNMMK